MINDPRFMPFGEDIWRKYIEPQGKENQIEWVLRRVEWGALLTRVFEAGFNEGMSEGGDEE